MPLSHLNIHKSLISVFYISKSLMVFLCLFLQLVWIRICWQDFKFSFNLQPPSPHLCPVEVHCSHCNREFSIHEVNILWFKIGRPMGKSFSAYTHSSCGPFSPLSLETACLFPLPLTSHSCSFFWVPVLFFIFLFIIQTNMIIIQTYLGFFLNPSVQKWNVGTQTKLIINK